MFLLLAILEAGDQLTEKQAYYGKYILIKLIQTLTWVMTVSMQLLHIERQQLMEDNKRLASEKEDLLKRLKGCEESLKSANDCEK